MKVYKNYLEVNMTLDLIEKCVSCNTDTQYKVSDNIHIRFGYIEGAGQLCKECYEEVY